MDAKESEAIRARLMLIEALLLMTIGTPYVERSKTDPDYDASQEVRDDAVRWFDTLVDQADYDPWILSREASRLLGALQNHVETRVKRRG